MYSLAPANQFHSPRRKLGLFFHGNCHEIGYLGKITFERRKGEFQVSPFVPVLAYAARIDRAILLDGKVDNLV
jgi:hypothetical protein